ncbi:MAG: DeoR family transcriptional regulator [bacterium]|nr:DeoR family transcriptional regulator [bacterium]
MNKDFLIQLTTNLYRLTLLFPKKEPLRYKIRELADNILADALRIAHCSHAANQSEYTNKTENCFPRILEDLEVLDSFFEVAEVQNWVSPAEALKLQQEYSKLKENLKTQANLVPVAQFRNILRKDLVASDLPPQSGGDCGENPQIVPFGKRVVKEDKSSFSPFAAARVNERQQKILEILKEREKAQVWEIKKFFPEVSKRTLRRDFEFLLQEGAVERIGERNDTFYKLKSIET